MKLYTKPPVLLAAILVLLATSCHEDSSTLLLNSCELTSGETAPAGADSLTVETVVNGLMVPWDIAFLPDGDMLVTERGGSLRLVQQGGLLPTPVLQITIPNLTPPFGFEGGVLGILLHPGFASNRLFYLYATVLDSNNQPINRLTRYRLAPNKLSAAVDKVILDDIPAGGHHQGGRMRIGPDGYLYVSVGAYDPVLAQDPDSLAGKLLRMTLEGEIPLDNPRHNSYVFASGIRNSQAFDWFDASHLLMMDHGPSGLELNMPSLTGFDELNVVRKGDNLGWPKIWGCQLGQGMIRPTLSWVNSVPPAGAVFYEGSANPSWNQSFLVTTLGGNVNGQSLLKFSFDPNNPYKILSRESYLQGTYGRLRAIVTNSQGDIFITTSNCDGRAFCPPTGDSILKVSVN